VAPSPPDEPASPGRASTAPPFLTRQSVALGASATLLLISMWGWRGFRVRRGRRMVGTVSQTESIAAERNRIAKDMHDQLGSHLTRIKLLSELIGKQEGLPESAAQHARHILRTTMELAQSMDEIVWAVNPSKDQLEHLISYVAASTEELLGVTHLRFRLDLPDHVPDVQLAAETRHHLFLAFKEGLHNAVKHSHATTILVRLHVADDQLQLTIQDDGIGMPAQPRTSLRNGLKNMSDRMVRIGGSCVINSQPGAGTAVCLTSPLARGPNDSPVWGT